MSTQISVEKIAETLEATVHTSDADLKRTVASACASDLMSDVLAFSKPRSILITGLNTPQTVRTAEVADILAVCFAFGKVPSADTVRLAEESNILLLTTRYSLFSASGMVYALGLCGCVESR